MEDREHASVDSISAPTNDDPQAETTSKPEKLCDMLNAYVISNDDKLVPSLLTGIAKATSETVKELLKVFDLRDLSRPNALSLRILDTLISKSEEEDIEISLDWLVTRDSADQYNMETTEAIVHLLGTLIQHWNTAEVYDVAVDFVDEILSTAENEPAGMAELLRIMCLFAEYAPDENDLSIWVNSYLLGRSSWLLPDWRLLNTSIRLEMNDIEYEEIQQRFPEEIRLLEPECKTEILAVMDSFIPWDRIERQLP